MLLKIKLIIFDRAILFGYYRGNFATAKFAKLG